MINLISGGDYAKKGYWYSMYLTYPEIRNSVVVNLQKREHKVNKISFPTKFMLTRNNTYFNIEIRILGLGLGLEIQSKN